MRKLSATSKAERQKNDLWGPSGTPLSVLRVNYISLSKRPWEKTTTVIELFLTKTESNINYKRWFNQMCVFTIGQKTR